MRHTGSEETSEITMSLRRREVRSLRNGAKTGSPRLGCERGQDTKADIDRLNSAAWKGSNRGIGSDVAVRFSSPFLFHFPSFRRSHSQPAPFPLPGQGWFSCPRMMRNEFTT